MNVHADTLNLFNCMVVNEHNALGEAVNTDLIDIGLVLDFYPSTEQATVLRQEHKPLDITTLFTREERENAPLEQLLTKQFLHYIEVYGLDAPGLFSLEVTQGEIVVLRYVRGVATSELEEMVQKLLYTNAPVKDAAQLKRIIEHYGLDYNVNRIKNNEMRVALYRPGVDTFDNGDDAVRYLCYVATGYALLIKSPEVITAIKSRTWAAGFFEHHEIVLAQVFNRHKRLILAAKNKLTATAINRIARLSKTRHVPIHESVAKTFVHRALTEVGFDTAEVLAKVSMRDKFKYLNLLAQKKLQSQTASFKIRNGKVHTRTDRPVYTQALISAVEKVVLESLEKDFGYLKGKNILLDKNVDYGLPISRKQSVGNLPFGTTVTSDSNEISSGMYWENEWGARDLDLSTIDLDGNRVGWGGRSAYDSNSGIAFSGDLTDARTGAIEFMTSRSKDYGLLVNIFAGENGAEMELVVGANGNTREKWIEDVLIREKHKLDSRNSVIGFVKGKQFVVYAGRLNESRISGANPIINESRVDPWTIQKLFDAIGVNFDVDRQGEMVYDHDLSYSSFSFDKLEAVFDAT